MSRRTIVDSLVLKIRRRLCPKCRRSLHRALVDVVIHRDGHVAKVGFICGNCGEQRQGEIRLNDRVRADLIGAEPPPAITAAEVAAVRELLGTWNGSLKQLIGVTAE